MSSTSQSAPQPADGFRNKQEKLRTHLGDVEFVEMPDDVDDPEPDPKKRWESYLKTLSPEIHAALTGKTKIRRSYSMECCQEIEMSPSYLDFCRFFVVSGGPGKLIQQRQTQTPWEF